MYKDHNIAICYAVFDKLIRKYPLETYEMIQYNSKSTLIKRKKLICRPDMIELLYHYAWMRPTLSNSLLDQNQYYTVHLFNVVFYNDYSDLRFTMTDRHVDVETLDERQIPAPCAAVNWNRCFFDYIDPAFPDNLIAELDRICFKHFERQCQ